MRSELIAAVSHSRIVQAHFLTEQDKGHEPMTNGVFHWTIIAAHITAKMDRNIRFSFEAKGVEQLRFSFKFNAF